MLTHAANPTPYIIDEEKGIVRIFFTCRNKEQYSAVSYVDLDFNNNFEILKIADKPVVSPGEPGLFDDNGASISWVLPINGKFYLYYLGYNIRVTVPWFNTIGLAIGDTIDGPFEKNALVPLLERSNEDPYTLSYPCILADNGIYRMWYGSNLKWGKTQNEMNHVIKYAESPDGIHWNRTNQIHINLQHPNEYALSKPYVIKKDNLYHMWYSYRGNGDITTYRIGYASSPDGNNWTRKDEEAGIDVSADGWDSDMICYPFVFDCGGNTYMLYNGNGYGRTGFGIAQLIK